MRTYGRSRMTAEQARRAQEEWDSWPPEAKIALAVIPTSILILANVAHLIPALQDAGIAEEASAGGTIIAILSVFLIFKTFGQAAQKKIEERRSVSQSAPRTLAGEHGMVRSTSVRQLDTTLDKLDAIHRRDPGFSQPSLSRFSQALLLRVAVLPKGQERTLLPYITPGALPEVRRRVQGGEVVPGEARITEVSETPVWTTLTVEQPFLVLGSEPRRVKMTWFLRRSSAARSPSPVDLLGFACPACGSPVEVTHPDGHCTTCDTGITHGQLSWQVVEVSGVPKAAWLGHDEQFGGGDHPSLLPMTHEDAELAPAMRGLSARHPETPIAEIEKRAAQAAVAWFEARILGSPKPAQGLFQATLDQALDYELLRAEHAGLKIAGGPVTVDQIEWARARQDGWHETADLRVFLTLPWTVHTAEGELVDGRDDQPRSQSVYVRMALPTGKEGGWRAWQIVDARTYAR